MKVAHLTSVHPRFDTRVFRKQCVTLGRAGYDVSLIVADGKGDVTVDGVRILDVGAARGRLQRMTKVPSLIYERALGLDAALYHLHDPELLPIALRLKRAGRKVIFDSHEDFPADILTKPYLSAATRYAVSRTFFQFERYACRKLDYIVAATPAIRGKFERIGCAVIDINNFPLLAEFSESLPWESSRAKACYVGAMTAIRGFPELIDAMALVEQPVRLALVGEFTEVSAGQRARQSAGWPKVDEHGFVGRKEVRAVMADSFAGLVTFLPAPNHIDSQPNKIFEYMAAGIPVIGSHFPLWREILEHNDCGICVDPSDPLEIARAIDLLYQDQDRARAMGERARTVVLTRFNWEREAPKLLALYETILGRRG